MTALVAEDRSSPPRRLRGVRIDLANQDTKEQVYLEEDKLPTIKDALDEISGGLARGMAVRRATLSYFGAAVFRPSNYGAFALTAAYYMAPDSSGLAIHPFESPEFRFPDRVPLDLAAPLALAIEKLKDR